MNQMNQNQTPTETKTAEPENPQENTQEGGQEEGVDGILKTIDSLTPQNVEQMKDQLKQDVMDLKDYMDGQGSGGGEPNGLTIMIGKHKGEMK